MADVADDPSSAHGSATSHVATATTLHSPVILAAVSDPTPTTTSITADPGDTLWVVAAQAGVGPGVLLRHNRGATPRLGQIDPQTGVDALAAGRPIARAETLIVPERSPKESTATTTDGLRPGLLTPELAELEPTFDRWADHFGVPRDLLKALAWVESGWNNDSRSAAGGVGIGRLQPLRAQYLAKHVAAMALDPTVAVDNIALTAAQLRVLLDETPDIPSAVAAHRQGVIDTRLSGVDPSLIGYVEAVLTMRLRFG